VEGSVPETAPGGAPAQSDPRAPWPPAAHVAVGCGAGCALLVLLEGVGLWSVFQVMSGMRAPSGAVTSIQTPATVRVGKPFSLTVVVRNEGASTFRVSNLIAGGPLTDALELTPEEPRPSSGPVRVMGSTTWSYGAAVEPRQTWKARFQAKARKAGTLRKSLQVQLDIAPKTVPFTVEVRP
jgi:hypothetical protein